MIELIKSAGSVAVGTDTKSNIELDVPQLITTEYVDEKIAEVKTDLNNELAESVEEVRTEASAANVALKDELTEDIEGVRTEAAVANAALKDELTEDITEAIASIPTGGDKELIASGTLTEAVNSVVISKDNNGNSFSLFDFIWIFVEMPVAAQNTRLSFNLYSSDGTQMAMGQVLNGLSTTAARNSKIIGFHTGYGWDYLLANTVATGEQSSINTLIKNFGKCKNEIGKITLYCYTASHILPVGMKYTIYGKRA